MRPILDSLSDAEVLQELGARIRAARQARDLTIEQAALKAGVHRNTLSKVEVGSDTQLSTLIRVLRTFGRLQMLDMFLPAPTVSPIQLTRQLAKLRQRQRVRPRKR